MRDHDLETNIEEFDAHPMAKLLPAILTIVLFVCLLVAGLTEGAVHFIVVILAIAAVGVPLYTHFSGMNLFENVGPASRSQNVVAVHRATGSKVVKGARPIVVVAHYDTPRESLLNKGPIARNKALLLSLSIPCMIAVAVSVLFQLMVFLPGVLRTITWVIGLIALIPLLFVAISTIYDRFAPCTEGANNNKSSVAALLSIANAVRPVQDRVDGVEAERPKRPARKRAGDEPEPEPEPRRVEVLEEVYGVRHGAEVLGSLGILPPSCEIVYKEPRIQVVEEETEVPALAPASQEYDEDEFDERSEDVLAEDDAKEGDLERDIDQSDFEERAVGEDLPNDADDSDLLEGEEAQKEDAPENEEPVEQSEGQSEEEGEKPIEDVDTQEDVEPAATTNARLSRSLPSFLESDDSKTGEPNDDDAYEDDQYDDEYDDEYDDYDDDYDDYDDEYEDDYEYEDEREDEDEKPAGVGGWFSARVASIREFFSKNRGSDVKIEPGEDRRYADDQDYEDYDEESYDDEYEDNQYEDDQYEGDVYDEDDRYDDDQYDDQYDEEDVYEEDEQYDNDSYDDTDQYEDDQYDEYEDEEYEYEQYEDEGADEDEYDSLPAEEAVEPQEVAEQDSSDEILEDDSKENNDVTLADDSGAIATEEEEIDDNVDVSEAVTPAAQVIAADLPSFDEKDQQDDIEEDQGEPEYEYSDYEYDEDEFEDEDNYDYDEEYEYEDEYEEEEEYVEDQEEYKEYEESEEGEYEESYEEDYEDEAYDQDESEVYEEDAAQAYEDADAYVSRKKTVGGRIARFFQKIRINEDDVRAASEAANELTPESGYTEQYAEQVEDYEEYEEHESYEEDQAYEGENQYESSQVYEEAYYEEDFYEDEDSTAAAYEPEQSMDQEVVPQEEMYVQDSAQQPQQYFEPQQQESYQIDLEQQVQESEPVAYPQQYGDDEYVRGEFAQVDLSFDDEVQDGGALAQQPEPEPAPEPLADPNLLHFDREEDTDIPPKDDTGLNMISESYDLFSGDVPRAAEYQKPIPVEDPNWGVTSYQPARPAMSIARRAALFDLPDPSRGSIDPFADEYEDYDDEYDEVTAQDAVAQQAEPAPEPEPAPAPEPEPEPAPEPAPEPESEQQEDVKADEPVRDPSSTGSFWGKPNGGQSDWKGGATTRADLAEGDEPIYIDAEDLQDAILEMGDEFLVAHDIWFVATGASEVDHAGMQAFIDTHRRDIRGAFLVNMDCIGSGALSLLVREGVNSPRRADRRLVRMITGIAQDLHIQLDTAICNWGEHDSATAMRSRVRSVTITGLDDNNLPAFSHTPDDVPENVDPRQVSDVVRIVTELIRRS